MPMLYDIIAMRTSKAEGEITHHSVESHVLSALEE